MVGSIDPKQSEVTMMALIAVFAFMFASAAFAQAGGVPLPEVDPLSALIELVKNWQAVGLLGGAMTLIVVVVQVLKKSFIDAKYSPLIVTVLSVLYSIGHYVAGGMSAVNAVITAVITGGGAVAIYEAYKNIKKVVAPK